MSAPTKLSHAEQVRRRRERQQARLGRTVSAPSFERLQIHGHSPKKEHGSRPRFANTPVMGGTARQVRQVARYQQSFALTRQERPSATIELPRLNMGRLASGMLSLALAFLLYTMWHAPLFQVNGAEIYGHQRLSLNEIQAAMHVIGQPIFKAAPLQIEASLRAAYPDLANVKVSVGLPNRIVVNLSERIPVIVWHQGEQTFWVDAEGVAFPVRGEASVLVTVVAHGNPPSPQPEEERDAVTPRFMEPSLVRAMATLFPYVPPGQSMVYDPRYGIGWEDSRGWLVYFGQSTEDIPLKLKIYQGIVDRLMASGITPTLISVEHLRAPFYK